MPTEFCSGARRNVVSLQVFYTCMDIASEFLGFFLPNFMSQTSRSGKKKKGGPGSLGPCSAPLYLLLLAKKYFSRVILEIVIVQWMIITFLKMMILWSMICVIIVQKAILIHFNSSTMKPN